MKNTKMVIIMTSPKTGGKGYMKKTMREILYERLEQLEQLKDECVKIMMCTHKMKLYKATSTSMEELEEDDSRWQEFCKNIFEENTIANRVIKNILNRSEWVEDISFIWREEKFSQEELNKIKPSVIIMPKENEKWKVIFVDNKRWKKLKIYFL